MIPHYRLAVVLLVVHVFFGFAPMHAQRFSEMATPSGSSEIMNGPINAVCFDPTDTLKIWAAAAGGGVWHTTNGGMAWKAMGLDTTALTATSTIVFIPGSRTGLKVGLGDIVDSLGAWTAQFSYSKRLFALSTRNDSTSSWSQLTTNEYGYFIPISEITWQLLAPTSSAGWWIVCTNHGFYRSRTLDSLVSLSSLTLTVPPAYCDVQRKPSSDAFLYGYFGSYIYTSQDSGKTWTNSAATKLVDCSRAKIACSASNNSVAYVMSSDQKGAFNGLYRSTNSGATWVLQGLYPNILGIYPDGKGAVGSAKRLMSLVCSPLNESELYAASTYIWKSTDNGRNWVRASSDVQGDSAFVWKGVRSLVFHPTKPTWLYACTDNGIYKTSDGGSHWMRVSTSINAMVFESLATHPLNDSIVFAAGALGTYRFDQKEWKRIHDSSVTSVQCDSRFPHRVRICTKDGYLLESNDDGTHFDTFRSPSGAKRFADPHPYYVSPLSYSTQFANLTSLFYSYDAGKSWRVLQPPGKAAIKNLVPDAVDSSTVYAFCADATVWMMQGIGTDWQKFTLPLAHPATEYVSLVSVPGSDRTLRLLTKTGYLEASFSSRYFGTEYTLYHVNIGVPLTKNIVGGFWKSDLCSKDFFVRTAEGLIQCYPRVNSWIDAIKLSDLPATEIRSAQVADTVMYVATAGRGLWRGSAFSAEPKPSFTTNVRTICPLETIHFTSTSRHANSVRWRFEGGVPESSVANEVDVIFSGSGSHTVHLYASGCATDIESLDSVNVLPKQFPRLRLSNSDPCLGDTITISDISTMSCENRSLRVGAAQIDFGTRDSVNLVCTQTGTIPVVLTRRNACFADSSELRFEVHDLPRHISIIEDSSGVLRCSDTTLMVYQWLFNSKSIAGATKFSFRPSESGSYSVSVLSTYRCAYTSPAFPYTQTSVVVDVDAADLFISPQPCHDKLQLRWDLKSELGPVEALRIFDSRGRCVLSQHLSEQSSGLTLDLRDLPAAPYILELYGSATRRRVHFVKL